MALGSDARRVSVSAVVALMVVIACSVPARRAARIDPLAALSDQ